MLQLRVLYTLDDLGLEWYESSRISFTADNSASIASPIELPTDKLIQSFSTKLRFLLVDSDSGADTPYRDCTWLAMSEVALSSIIQPSSDVQPTYAVSRLDGDNGATILHATIPISSIDSDEAIASISRYRLVLPSAVVVSILIPPHVSAALLDNEPHAQSPTALLPPPDGDASHQDERPITPRALIADAPVAAPHDTPLSTQRPDGRHQEGRGPTRTMARYRPPPTLRTQREIYFVGLGAARADRGRGALRAVCAVACAVRWGVHTSPTTAGVVGATALAADMAVAAAAAQAARVARAAAAASAPAEPPTAPGRAHIRHRDGWSDSESDSGASGGTSAAGAVGVGGAAVPPAPVVAYAASAAAAGWGTSLQPGARTAAGGAVGAFGGAAATIMAAAAVVPPPALRCRGTRLCVGDGAAPRGAARGGAPYTAAGGPLVGFGGAHGDGLGCTHADMNGHMHRYGHTYGTARAVAPHGGHGIGGRHVVARSVPRGARSQPRGGGPCGPAGAAPRPPPPTAALARLRSGGHRATAGGGRRLLLADGHGGAAVRRAHGGGDGGVFEDRCDGDAGDGGGGGVHDGAWRAGGGGVARLSTEHVRGVLASALDGGGGHDVLIHGGLTRDGVSHTLHRVYQRGDGGGSVVVEPRGMAPPALMAHMMTALASVCPAVAGGHECGDTRYDPRGGVGGAYGGPVLVHTWATVAGGLTHTNGVVAPTAAQTDEGAARLEGMGVWTGARGARRAGAHDEYYDDDDDYDGVVSPAEVVALPPAARGSAAFATRVHVYDMVCGTWTTVRTTMMRAHAAAVAACGVMLVHGGVAADGRICSTTVALDLAVDDACVVARSEGAAGATGAPSRRYAHTLTLAPLRRMAVMFGGLTRTTVDADAGGGEWGGDVACDDEGVWCYDLSAMPHAPCVCSSSDAFGTDGMASIERAVAQGDIGWFQMTSSGDPKHRPTPRFGHSAVVVSDQLLICGGARALVSSTHTPPSHDGSSTPPIGLLHAHYLPATDAWLFSFATRQWARLAVATGPPPLVPVDTAAAAKRNGMVPLAAALWAGAETFAKAQLVRRRAVADEAAAVAAPRAFGTLLHVGDVLLQWGGYGPVARQGRAVAAGDPSDDDDDRNDNGAWQGGAPTPPQVLCVTPPAVVESHRERPWDPHRGYTAWLRRCIDAVYGDAHYRTVMMSTSQAPPALAYVAAYKAASARGLSAKQAEDAAVAAATAAMRCAGGNLAIVAGGHGDAGRIKSFAVGGRGGVVTSR